MRKFICTLAIAGLTSALAAQTPPPPPQTLEATNLAAVEVKFATNKPVTKTIAATGKLTKPVMISAMDKDTNARYYNAFARMSAGLRSGCGHHWGPSTGGGAYLHNYGKVYGTTAKPGYAKGFNQAFKWTYDTGKELNGKIKVVFSGYAYGGAIVSAGFGLDSWKSDPLKPGNFSFTKEYNVVKAAKLIKAFTMAADTKTVKTKAHYSGHLNISYMATVAQPTLAFSIPTQTANCGLGKVSTSGTVAFGQKFNIELKGATDTGKVAAPYAMLYLGDSTKNWFFFTLPLDLGPLGAKGCDLRLAIFNTKVVKMEKGAASFPIYISSMHAKYFKKAYYQIGYMTDLNTLGIKLTDYAVLEKK